MLINIHTHHSESKFKDKKILNLIDGEDSFGIHPWKVCRETRIDTLEKEIGLKKEKIIFVGETGLDRAFNFENFLIQKDVFIEHLNLSNKIDRPLIVHLVRSYDLFFEIIKKYKFKKMIIHDFRANQEILNQLLKYPIYFSFGPSLLKNIKQQNLFKSTPLNKIFLETDDTSIEIQEIYLKAAELLSFSPKKLESQIIKNTSEFFSDFHNQSSSHVINDLNEMILDQVFYFDN